MTIARKVSSIAAVAMAAALAGCMSAGPIGGPIVSKPSGVEGDWMSTDGVAISRFAGGVFETVATDTGNKLADGNYRYADNRTVEITVISLIRQTTTNVNCALANPSQLNCTSSTGQQFVLTRRRAAG